ncbi:hypothetical protein EKI60_01350 [Candidatus Saccharibacteria bacterium]|nr:MAG: hypothetical protein EKI60_01350 [Candidatus Saccharibacteria bacterium]
MDDITVRDSNDAPKKSKRSKNVTFVFNRKAFYVASAIVVLVVVFFLGSAYGSKKDGKASNAGSSPRSSSSSNRWTSVGTVQEISDAKVKVKDSRGQEKEAEINKETKIVDRKGTALKPADIKKDSRVIVSGEKDGDKLTATRIRLQQ